MTALANPNDDPIPYRLTAKGAVAFLPASVAPIPPAWICGQRDPLDGILVTCCLECDGCGAVMTLASDGRGIKVQTRDAWLRAENRRQKAAYRAGIVGPVCADSRSLDVNNSLRAHRANLRSQVDRLATRLSFSEAAARQIWGGQPRAWWRYPAGSALACFNSYTDTIDWFMTWTTKPDIARVPKSELVRAHRATLEHDRCEDFHIIGERSPLP